MARIAGVDLPRNKRIISTDLHSWNRTHDISAIIEKCGLDPNLRSDSLSEVDVRNIRRVIEDKYKVEGDLRREVQLNIKRLMDLGCYRGLRHRRGLPVRGQRTKTNARTRKGPRRTVTKKKK